MAAADRGEWPAAIWDAVEQAGLPLGAGAGGAGRRRSAAGRLRLRLVRRAGYHTLPVPLAETMIAASALGARLRARASRDARRWRRPAPQDALSASSAAAMAMCCTGNAQSRAVGHAGRPRSGPCARRRTGRGISRWCRGEPLRRRASPQSRQRAARDAASGWHRRCRQKQYARRRRLRRGVAARSAR